MKQQQSESHTVAVTGASGHVGANLIRALLADGRSVRVLEHKDSRGYEGLDVQVVEGDVLNEKTLGELVDGVDIVYHLAAKIYLGAGEDKETENVNVIGTRNVANACLNNNVKRLIHFSSIHALSPYPKNEIVDEKRNLITSESAPCYDCSKAAAEEEIYAAVKRGLDAVVISPAGIIGPFDFKPSPMGKLLLDLNRLPFFPLCEGGFYWVDVRDVAAGAIAAEMYGKRGERYLLAGEWLSLLSIADIVSECSSKHTHCFALPVKLAEIVAFFIEKFGRLTKTSPSFTTAAVHTLQHYRHVNIEKAKNELGFSPRPIKQTISDTLSWYREIGK